MCWGMLTTSFSLIFCKNSTTLREGLNPLSGDHPVRILNLLSGGTGLSDAKLYLEKKSFSMTERSNALVAIRISRLAFLCDLKVTGM